MNTYRVELNKGTSFVKANNLLIDEYTGYIILKVEEEIVAILPGGATVIKE